MKSQTSRRAFVCALPALATTPALALPQNPSECIDSHPEWLAQWQAARARWRVLAKLPGNENWDAPESIECDRIQSAMERQLETVPATTLEGACACMEWVLEEASVSEWLYQGHREAIENAHRAILHVMANSSGGMKARERAGKTHNNNL